MNNLQSQRQANRSRVWAWCCYDWANSGYTTLMITVFVVYIQKFVFAGESWGQTGPIVWAWSVSISMLIGAILSPFLGAFADARDCKREWLAGTAATGGLACIAMASLPSHQVWGITGCFLVANLCLELSLTVYNGFLPEVADDQEMNRVSSLGMALGYLGGGILLLLAIVFLRYGHHLGAASMEAKLRWAIASTGIWWFVFSLPTIVVLRDRETSRVSDAAATITAWDAVRQAARDVKETVVEMRRYATLAAFLGAFLFFNDGVQTVISQSSTFALQELRFSESELAGVILMVQFLAFPGAIAVGKLADRVGQKPALVSCLVVWIGLLTSAWFIESKAAYWLMAAVVALVLGGTQAVSRAIVGVLAPKDEAAKFFGFFNLSGKATSFMGTFLFGSVIALTGSSRLAVVNLLVFFLIGLAIVSRLKFQPDNRQLTKSLPHEGIASQPSPSTAPL